MLTEMKLEDIKRYQRDRKRLTKNKKTFPTKPIILNQKCIKYLFDSVKKLDIESVEHAIEKLEINPFSYLIIENEKGEPDKIDLLEHVEKCGLKIRQDLNFKLSEGNKENMPIANMGILDKNLNYVDHLAILTPESKFLKEFNKIKSIKRYIVRKREEVRSNSTMYTYCPNEFVPYNHYSSPIVFQYIRNNDLQRVKLLTSKYININCQSNLLETCLHMCAIHGRREIAEFLIEEGIDLNARNINSETALYIAVANKKFEMVKTLINAGAYLNAKDINGRTALYIAAANKNFEMVETLIKVGADLKLNDIYGKTVFMAALEQTYNYDLNEDRKNIINLLLKKDVEINLNYSCILNHQSHIVEKKNGNINLLEYLIIESDLPTMQAVFNHRKQEALELLNDSTIQFARSLERHRITCLLEIHMNSKLNNSRWV